MRIELDAELCQAYGNCLLAAPEVFDLTETTPMVLVLQERPDESIWARVEEAVQSCPVQALSLHER